MDILKSLDIALAMIVVYLTFALGVTALNESLAALLSSRARWLRKGITALLTPVSQAPQAAAQASAEQQASAFYRSPYIGALGRAAGWQPRFAPSYIAPWTRMQGLLDVASGARGTLFATMKEIEAAVAKLPEGSPIRIGLAELSTRANGNLDEFRKLVDAWFKSFDEQVSAWYRQKTQFVLLGLSALLAVGMNLDTIALFRTLSTDAKTRAALVDRAVEASRQPSAAAMLDLKPLQEAQRKLAEAKETGKPAAELAEAERQVDAERKLLDEAARDLLSSVEATGLPIGWSEVDTGSMKPHEWLLKAIGLALSAFALSMGAPFWFDLLQKVASIRAVGRNPIEREARKPAG